MYGIIVSQAVACLEQEKRYQEEDKVRKELGLPSAKRIKIKYTPPPKTESDNCFLAAAIGFIFGVSV
jgi:hypothetical protein